MRRDLLVPALIGLGLYTQSNEVCLCNNTTILLILFLVLQDHQEIEELRHELDEERDEIQIRNNRFDFDCCDCGCGCGCDGRRRIRRRDNFCC